MLSATAPSQAMGCAHLVTLLTLALHAHLPVPVRKVSVTLESTVLVSVYPATKLLTMALTVTTLALARTVLAGRVSMEMGFVPIVSLPFLDLSVINSVAVPILRVMMGSAGMVLVLSASRDSGVLIARIVPV